MHRETKKFVALFIALFAFLQYLRGMPVMQKSIAKKSIEKLKWNMKKMSLVKLLMQVHIKKKKKIHFPLLCNKLQKHMT